MTKGPMGGAEIFKARRQKLLEQIKDGVGILFAQPEQVRNNDVHHAYRQDSSFYYLTGFTEPESVLVLNPNSATPSTLFVREKDPTRELWDGFRYGTEGAQKYFGADRVYPITELQKVLSELLKNTDKIYFRIGENHEFDSTVETAIETARKSRGRSGLGMPALVDLKQIIGEMRLYKSADEIALLRKACEISAEGHLRAMRVCKPGMYEYQIEAEIMHEFRMRGSERLGYGSIVGRGANATVLHYVSNNDKLMSDDLILIDAGAEYGYFTGDITRTFPVNGKFSPPQKKLYEAVLKVQKSCIAFAKPGVKLADIHQHAIAGLVDEMLELKLLSGSKNSLIENKDFFKYYPHGTGHWLGMDVHDAGLYTKNGEGRKLEPGMCFTIEPGLYVPVDDKNAPAEYRGLGIRIEDDILITPQGCEVLTSLAPKDVEAIEAIIGTESGPKSYRV